MAPLWRARGQQVGTVGGFPEAGELLGMLARVLVPVRGEFFPHAERRASLGASAPRHAVDDTGLPRLTAYTRALHTPKLRTAKPHEKGPFTKKLNVAVAKLSGVQCEWVKPLTPQLTRLFGWGDPTATEGQLTRARKQGNDES